MPENRWFDRRFEPGVPVDRLPDILERLQGTPLRLRERLSEASESTLGLRVDGGWSIL